VKVELEQLIALQQADTAIRKLQAELDAIPKRRAEIEAEFDQRAFDFKSLEQTRDVARSERSRLDLELQETRTRAEKAERDLMSSTNSKAYEAAIREIDAAKKHVSELETKILEQMEAFETAEKTIAEHEPEVAHLRAEHDERIAAFEGQMQSQTEALASRRAERERIFVNLPPSARSVYNRISARIRDGIAVAEARNNACSACFMSLRPQVMAQIRRGEEIILCDNCSRILFYAPADIPRSTTTMTAT
jgi:predicted  nucleic acid-binding Zn-ribbon protein